MCASFPTVPPNKTFDQCWDENVPFRQIALAPYWPPILFLSMTPIPLFWLFGWATIAVFKWVRGGFVADNQVGR